MSKLLSDGDLLDLTGTPQHKRQLSILRDMGLTPLKRPDGSLALSWEAVHAVMTGANLTEHKGGRCANWGALDGPKAA